MIRTMKTIQQGLALLVAVAWLPFAAIAQQKAPLDEVQIVATTAQLADMVRSIGGDHVEIDTLAKPGSDPHGVLPKASQLLLLKRADGLISMGLDYEHAFLPALLEKSRNSKLKPEGGHHEIVGVRIQALEVPLTLDRSQGADLHPRGNPHFDLDPEGGRKMALAARDLLQRIDPGRRQYYQDRWQEWDAKAVKVINEWRQYLKPLNGQKVVAYHNSWPYFEQAFGLDFIGFVEPKPGLRPSPKHLAELGRQMTQSQVKVVVMEPWYSQSEIRSLLQRTQCKAVVLPILQTEKANAYLAWMEELVEKFGTAHGLPSLKDWRLQQSAKK